VREALKQLNMKADYKMIADLNVMKAIGLEYTPALEINGKMISEGKFYTVDEMKALLQEYTKALP
tara:strand:+ start:174 stop:368 length:195 start_codon:yes stop_codon:yes gene_type:complete